MDQCLYLQTRRLLVRTPRAEMFYFIFSLLNTLSRKVNGKLRTECLTLDSLWHLAENCYIYRIQCAAKKKDFHAILIRHQNWQSKGVDFDFFFRDCLTNWTINTIHQKHTNCPICFLVEVSYNSDSIFSFHHFTSEINALAMQLLIIWQFTIPLRVRSKLKRSTI